MLTSIKGVYENGTIRLTEEAPAVTHSEVLITFLDEEKAIETDKKPQKVGVRFGSWKGLFKLPDNFNEPMDELKDYM